MGGLKSSCDDVISAVNFFFDHKHCNTGGRSMWTIRGTTLKNKPHLATFHKFSNSS